LSACWAFPLAAWNFYSQNCSSPFLPWTDWGSLFLFVSKEPRKNPPAAPPPPGKKNKGKRGQRGSATSGILFGWDSNSGRAENWGPREA
jgi:hypothetical protein